MEFRVFGDMLAITVATSIKHVGSEDIETAFETSKHDLAAPTAIV